MISFVNQIQSSKIPLVKMLRNSNKIVSGGWGFSGWSYQNLWSLHVIWKQQIGLNSSARGNVHRSSLWSLSVTRGSLVLPPGFCTHFLWHFSSSGVPSPLPFVGPCSGCHNERPQTLLCKPLWVAYTTEIYFLIVLEAWSPRSRCRQVGVLLRPPSMACRQPPSFCVLTWPFSLCGHSRCLFLFL